MIKPLNRLARALRWRANIVLGIGASTPPAGYQNNSSASDVAQYYDDFTQAYLTATGPFLQAFRGRDTDALMQYYVARCGIVDGMNILDAGCGVGAPAIWLAMRFPNVRIACLTISKVQADHCRRSAQEAGVADRVTVIEGDFHALSQLYDHGQFDRALFLETLGHSDNLHAVLYGVRDVLKKGGQAYIKDFFQRRSLNADLRTKIQTAIDTINCNYHYHVMQLPDLVGAAMETGFTIASVGPPDIEPDLELTVDFEHEAGRLTYPVFARLHAVDWYEVVLSKE